MNNNFYLQLQNFKKHIDNSIKLRDQSQSLYHFLSENQGHCLIEHLKETIHANKHQPQTLDDKLKQTIHDIQTLIHAYPVLSTQVAINIIEAKKTFGKQATRSYSPTMDDLANSFVSFLAKDPNDYDLAWQRTFNFHQNLVANPDTRRYKDSKRYTDVMETKIPERFTAFGSADTIEDALSKLKKPTNTANKEYQTKGAESVLRQKSLFADSTNQSSNLTATVAVFS